MSKENKVNFNAKNKTISHGSEYDVTYTYCKDDQTLEFYDDNGVYVGSVNSEMLDIMKKDLEYAKVNGSLEPDYVSFFEAYTDMYNNPNTVYKYIDGVSNSRDFIIKDNKLMFESHYNGFEVAKTPLSFLESQRWYKVK